MLSILIIMLSSLVGAHGALKVFGGVGLYIFGKYIMFLGITKATRPNSVLRYIPYVQKYTIFSNEIVGTTYLLSFFGGLALEIAGIMTKVDILIQSGMGLFILSSMVLLYGKLHLYGALKKKSQQIKGAKSSTIYTVLNIMARISLFMPFIEFWGLSEMNGFALTITTEEGLDE